MATKVLSEGDKSLAEEYRPVEQPTVEQSTAYRVAKVVKTFGFSIMFPKLLTSFATTGTKGHR